jgi:hypothetical protein
MESLFGDKSYWELDRLSSDDRKVYFMKYVENTEIPEWHYMMNMACQLCDVNLVKWVYKNANIINSSLWECSLIQGIAEACGCGEIDIINLLVGYITNMGIFDLKDCEYWLENLCRGGSDDIEIAQMLIDFNPKMNMDEALSHSLEWGCFECARLLIEHGASIGNDDDILATRWSTNVNTIRDLINTGISHLCLPTWTYAVIMQKLVYVNMVTHILRSKIDSKIIRYIIGEYIELDFMDCS